jgi:hypothetical protein
VQVLALWLGAPAPGVAQAEQHAALVLQSAIPEAALYLALQCLSMWTHNAGALSLLAASAQLASALHSVCAQLVKEPEADSSASAAQHLTVNLNSSPAVHLTRQMAWATAALPLAPGPGQVPSAPAATVPTAVAGTSCDDCSESWLLQAQAALRAAWPALDARLPLAGQQLNSSTQPGAPPPGALPVPDPPGK